MARCEPCILGDDAKRLLPGNGFLPQFITLVYYIIGDNGASAEGTLNGAYNEMANFNGLAALETPEFLMERLDKLGGPESYNHYAVGWAQAMNAPYQWTKQVASHWGGTRNGAVVSWPNGIKAKGEIRSQFHHVIDIAPTILEAAGLPEPVSVNGIQQRPIEGVSMLYSFNDPKAAERRETQYFEMFGNRGIYHKGWTAVTKHGTPWVLVGRKTVPLDDDVWELYDTNKDWSQANDLSKQMPEKLHELQRLWLIEATRYNVLPIDDRVIEKLNPDTAGRPVLIKGNTQLLFGGMGRLSENCVLNIKNKSHAITAEIEVPNSGAEGVIIAQGANIGGWSLYTKGGKLKYCYNVAGVNHYYVEATSPLPVGEHQVRMEFAYAGGGLGKGGQVTLYVDGKKVGEGTVPMTQAIVFSADDGCDVGEDSGAPVSPDYGSRGNAFNGRVKGVQLAIADAAENSDHLVFPARVEFSLVLVGPLLGHVVGGVRRAWREVNEEGFVRCQRLLLRNPGHGLVSHVLHEVIALFGRLLWFDRRGALVQRRIPLVRLAADETVKIFEPAAARWPGVKRPHRARLPHRHLWHLPKCAVE
jgi:Sulfatase